MPNDHLTSLTEALLQGASDSTKAAVAALCNNFAPHATEVFKLLIANGGDYDAELAAFGRSERSLVLEFSKDIHAGNASIPQFCLHWTKKKGPTDVRERDCIGVIVGEAADSFSPLITDHTLQKAKLKGTSLSNLIQRAGLTLEEVAKQSGAPLETLEALCRGEGKLLSTRAGGLAVVLKVPYEAVRKAFNVSRRHADMGFKSNANIPANPLTDMEVSQESVEMAKIHTISTTEVPQQNLDAPHALNFHIKKGKKAFHLPRTTITKLTLPDGRHAEMTIRFV